MQNLAKSLRALVIHKLFLQGFQGSFFIELADQQLSQCKMRSRVHEYQSSQEIKEIFFLEFDSPVKYLRVCKENEEVLCSLELDGKLLFSSQVIEARYGLNYSSGSYVIFNILNAQQTRVNQSSLLDQSALSGRDKDKDSHLELRDLFLRTVELSVQKENLFLLNQTLSEQLNCKNIQLNDCLNLIDQLKSELLVFRRIAERVNLQLSLGLSLEEGTIFQQRLIKALKETKNKTISYDSYQSMNKSLMSQISQLRKEVIRGKVQSTKYKYRAIKLESLIEQKHSQQLSSLQNQLTAQVDRLLQENGRLTSEITLLRNTLTQSQSRVRQENRASQSSLEQLIKKVGRSEQARSKTLSQRRVLEMKTRTKQRRIGVALQILQNLVNQFNIFNSSELQLPEAIKAAYDTFVRNFVFRLKSRFAELRSWEETPLELLDSIQACRYYLNQQNLITDHSESLRRALNEANFKLKDQTEELTELKRVNIDLQLKLHEQYSLRSKSSSASKKKDPLT